MSTEGLTTRRKLVPIEFEREQSDEIGVTPGFRIGNVVIVSGQAANGPDGNVVGIGDFRAQAEQAFENLKSVLELGGSSLDDVVKVTIFLTDMTHYDTLVEMRKRYFSPPYPADTIAEVKGLGRGGQMIEIEAYALASS
jgi:reactive intermediate/imine deaminase